MGISLDWTMDRIGTTDVTLDRALQAQPTTSNYSREDLLRNRASWIKLGHGFEGEVYRYERYVIKIYREEHSPFRNCWSTGQNKEWFREGRWPTEIPASLLMGGLSPDGHIDSNANYLPVVDYHLSPTADVGDDEARKPMWHLVTPFLSLGSLDSLAHRLGRSKDASYTSDQLDIHFRPSLNSMLEALSQLHSAHGLCHDDVKGDNIWFAPDSDDRNLPTHWLLGDLGNVREQHHPYHSTEMWTGRRKRKNLPDCRSNDVFRLMKTYMLFLRNAAKDKVAWDEEFLRGDRHWARLFWHVRADAILKHLNGHDVDRRSLDLSRALPPRNDSGSMDSLADFDEATRTTVPYVDGGSVANERKVFLLLKVSASEYPHRLWGLVPLLGIPSPACPVA